MWPGAQSGSRFRSGMNHRSSKGAARAVRCIVAAFLVGAMALPACGGATPHCRPQHWEGQCKLGAVRTVRITEAFPRSYVTLQVSYEPQPNATSPALTPPEVRQEFRIPADQEDQLRDHLEHNALLPCQETDLADATCSPGKVQVAIPEFVPHKTQVAAEASGPKNCQLLETEGSSQDKPLKPDQLPGIQLPKQLLFATGSADVDAALQGTLSQIAQTLASHPELQCLALTGHVAAGESSLLAAQRARAVKDQLLKLGVDGTRLVSFGGAVPLYGEQQLDRKADPRDQNVALSVLLYKKPGKK
jgi:outer membrane protein OmpA-like peptidoglycan-associated protein